MANTEIHLDQIFSNTPIMRSPIVIRLNRKGFVAGVENDIAGAPHTSILDSTVTTPGISISP